MSLKSSNFRYRQKDDKMRNGGFMSDQPSNLFDLSANNRKKKARREIATSQSASSNASPSNISLQEAQSMLKQMKDKHNELIQKVDKSLEKSGHDSKELSDYFSNPSNFSGEEWRQLQQKKEEMETTILGFSSELVKQKKRKKIESKMTKQRKGKTLGARKNWIDMR